VEGDIAKDLPPGKGHADPVDREDFDRRTRIVRLHAYRLLVDTPSATAFCSAFTSASIHD
jgi:hypothetical protein